MELTENILKNIFTKSKSEIQFVHGAKRKIVDILMAMSVLKRNYKTIWKNALSLLNAGKSSSTNLFKNNKFVYFNGNIYIDCFAPKWPGNVFNRMVKNLINNLGKEPAQWIPFIPYLVIAITKKCMYRCEHCYAINSLGNKEVVSLEKLLEIVRGFQKIGLGSIAWEGGEPLLRFDDLITLLEETHNENEAWIATTAYGLTSEKAQRLKEAGLTAAIISLDHYVPDKHNKFRGNKKAFDMAIDGVRIFRETGIIPAVCICATREIVNEGGLYHYLELAKKIGTAFIQILDATPSGNYIGKDVNLSDSQLEEIKNFHIRVNTDPEFQDYPGISARALLEDDNNYGCCAANGLCYVDLDGNLQACDLLQISFGNLLEEGVEPVYKRMKEYFPHFLSGRCPAQTEYLEIADEFTKSKALPIPYKNCLYILEKISQRGMPEKLQTVYKSLSKTR